MKNTKEYRDGFGQGFNGNQPNLGMFNRGACCQGYIDGSKTRKCHLLNPARKLEYIEKLDI